jgi:DNA transformation protein
LAREETMPVTAGYIDFVRDLLAHFEPLRIRRMFGGAGVYSGELFFAILADDTLYLKVDDNTRADCEARRLLPFRYRSKQGKTMTMGYYPLPADVLEDPEELRAWATRAVEAADRSATGGRSPRDQGFGNG